MLDVALSRADVRLRCVACLGMGARETETVRDRDSERQRGNKTRSTEDRGQITMEGALRSWSVLKRPPLPPPWLGNRATVEEGDTETLGILAFHDLCAIETLHRFPFIQEP